jgi:hydroxypyruvate reductase
VIAVPQLPTSAAERITFIEGGHPTPTEGTLLAGRAIADLLAQATARDLVVALISGGGSALLELPVEGLALADLRITNQQLLLSGAAVHEINVVRQRLSQLKGGGLARLAYPARVLGLILSDVVGNPLGLVASGPTVPATASPQAALAVVEKYHLRSALPSAVLRRLEGVSSSATRAADTSSAAASVDNRLIASNRLAGEAAAAAARELGFVAALIADDWQGEAREAGERFARLVSQKARGQGEGGRGAGGWPACLIVGGETTVTVRGAGRGGRNQEAALAAALVIDGLPNVVISTFATDGVDGPTDAAGAIVTGDTLARARALGLDPQKHLDDNDSYSFFAALSNLVVTGPTGTNVNDLMFGLVYSRRADSV